MKKNSLILGIVFLLFSIASCSETPFIEDKVIVKFDTLGGNHLEQIILDKGTTLSLPVPVKEGYTFSGWSTGFGPFDIIFTNYNPVLEDLELFAVWEVNIYTITIDGGLTYSLEFSESINIPEPKVRPFMDFLGWYFDEELSNQFELESMPAYDFILYPKYVHANIYYGDEEVIIYIVNLTRFINDNSVLDSTIFNYLNNKIELFNQLHPNITLVYIDRNNYLHTYNTSLFWDPLPLLIQINLNTSIIFENYENLIKTTNLPFVDFSYIVSASDWNEELNQPIVTNKYFLEINEIFLVTMLEGKFQTNAEFFAAWLLISYLIDTVDFPPPPSE
jgi:hypothetical protein